MWEAVKKPATLSESSGSSCEADGSLLTTGPVRLQTLIDRVLDSSLNNRNSAATTGSSLGSQVATAVQLIEDKAATPSNTSRGSPAQQWNSVSEKSSSAPNDKRLSFKNHIEKVLLESFLSYEEDERKEDLKKKTIANGPSVKANSDSQTSVKECTISVQDLVDQVISHTETNSKRLTPSTRDTSKPAPSHVQTDKAKSSLASGNESNQKPGVHSVSPQSTALIEAQRHLVQKELQSSTTLGRKRGRPQLNASGSSNNSATELAKDPNAAHYRDRVQEGKSSHCHTRMSPLNYASKGSLQYGIPVSIAPLSSHSVAAASATTVLQNRQYFAQNPKELPSSIRASLPSISLDYRLQSREPFHQQPESQHLSSQTYQNLSHPHNSGFVPSTKVLPPLILTDQVSSSQVIPVPHAPTKSCSCHVCLNHFSQGQSHPAITQHHKHHHLTTQDKTGNTSIHPSSFNSYQPHLKTFKDIYPPQASTVSEAVMPVLTAPIQGTPSVVMTTQENIQHCVPTSRETPPSHHVHSNPLSGHNHHHPNVTLLEPKFPDAPYHASKPSVHLDIHGSDFMRLTRNIKLHPGREENQKAEAAGVFAQTGKDCELPLDLSLKPRTSGKHEKRQEVWEQDRTSPYR